MEHKHFATSSCDLCNVEHPYFTPNIDQFLSLQNIDKSRFLKVVGMMILHPERVRIMNLKGTGNKNLLVGLISSLMMPKKTIFLETNAEPVFCLASLPEKKLWVADADAFEPHAPCSEFYSRLLDHLPVTVERKHQEPVLNWTSDLAGIILSTNETSSFSNSDFCVDFECNYVCTKGEKRSFVDAIHGDEIFEFYCAARQSLQ
jgi:hypothetical protein